jgi:hypothetical protein
MKFLFKIWGTWLVFLAMCMALVALVEHGPALPGVKPEASEEHSLTHPDPSFLELKGDQMIPAETEAGEEHTSQIRRPDEDSNPQPVQSVTAPKSESAVKSDSPGQNGEQVEKDEAFDLLGKVKGVPARGKSEEKPEEAP